MNLINIFSCFIQRDDNLKALNIVTKGLSLESDRDKIINVVKQYLPQEQVNVMRYVPALITANMGCRERQWIIRMLAHIPVGQRKMCRVCISSIINKKFSFQERIEAIEVMMEIPQDQRANVCIHAKPLIKGVTDRCNQVTIIKRIADISQDQRADVCIHALPLIGGVTDGLY